MAESAQDVRRMALAFLQSHLMNYGRLVDEFRSVLVRDPTIRHSQTAAHASANQVKNRYSNVLPYDHNRVLLRACGDAAPFPSASLSPASSDYINASHVVHHDPQYGFSVAYIASQGPLPGTESDFWRMCWCERVGAVVMLTNLVERGVTKCGPYYPAEPGKRLALRVAAAGGATSAGGCVSEVVALSSEPLHRGELRRTELRLVGEGENEGPRTVSHLHFTAWPDHGTPADGAAICSICDRLEPVRAAGGAVVVHCSAGIGRTGTFCAIDILRRRLAALEQRAEAKRGSVRQDDVRVALDLAELVHSLRQQRCGMVQTHEQYAFCYQAVCEELAERLGGVGGGGGGRRGSGGVGGRGGGEGGRASTPPRQGQR